jgi:hypothetical protein
MSHDEEDVALPEREYQTMFGGVAVYFNPTLAPGTIQFRNRDGEIVGTIFNIKQIDLAGRLPR